MQNVHKMDKIQTFFDGKISKKCYNNVCMYLYSVYKASTIKEIRIQQTHLMPCFSATSALPNNSLILLRTSVTVTVTIAPAVTTFVFSSSITVKMNKIHDKIYKFDSGSKVDLPSHLMLKSMSGILPKTRITCSYSKSLKCFKTCRLSSGFSWANCCKFLMWRFLVENIRK